MKPNAPVAQHDGAPMDQHYHVEARQLTLTHAEHLADEPLEPVTINCATCIPARHCKTQPGMATIISGGDNGKIAVRATATAGEYAFELGRSAQPRALAKARTDHDRVRVSTVHDPWHGAPSAPYARHESPCGHGIHARACVSDYWVETFFS